MTNIAPGVKCEIVPAACAGAAITPFVGMQCTAIEPDTSLLARLALFASPGGDQHQNWVVRLPDGDTLSCCRKCLRPLDPPHPDDGTWKRIQEITGWSPIKEPA